MNGRPTLVYRMASSHAVLTRGIIPSRWAMNSSGRTDVLVSISTMSIAAAKTRRDVPRSRLKMRLTHGRYVRDHYPSERICYSEHDVR